MKAVLLLEEIGCGSTELSKRKNKHLCVETRRGAFIPGRTPSPCWVARITESGHNEYIQGQRDYRTANSSLNRGVFLSYFLETGNVYKIKENTSWNHSRKYFAKVTDDGDIVEIDEAEVIAWLKAKSQSESMS